MLRSTSFDPPKEEERAHDDHPSRLAAASVAALLAVPALAEDLTVVFKTTSGRGRGDLDQLLLEREDGTGDADSETIVEYATGKITTIDHKKKEYSEITLAEMEAAMKAAQAKMEEANAQMKEQMAAMPPRCARRWSR